MKKQDILSVTVVLLSLLLCFFTFSVKAQDRNPNNPLLLFSTSEVVKESTAEYEVIAKLNQIRYRSEVLQVRLINIANFAEVIHTNVVQVELDGRKIVFKGALQQQVSNEKNTKHFWIGQSAGRDNVANCVG